MLFLQWLQWQKAATFKSDREIRCLLLIPGHLDFLIGILSDNEYPHEFVCVSIRLRVESFWIRIQAIP